MIKVLILGFLASRECYGLRITADTSAGVTNQDDGLKPIAWVHVPKCGSSFALSLYLNEQICPELSKHSESRETILKAKSNMHGLVSKVKSQQLCDGSFYPKFMGVHNGLPFEDYPKGHVITFFRQPEQRMLSHFYFMEKRYGESLKYNSAVDFAKKNQACYVKMLTQGTVDHTPTKDKHETVCSGGAPTHEEFHVAMERVREMPFVGLVEEWDFSICLFHSIYGGPCLDTDFMNTRPGVHHSGDLYDEDALLPNFKDEWDGPIYEAGKKRFWDLMKNNGLNRKTCQALCSNLSTQRPFDVIDASTEFASGVTNEPHLYDWPGRPAYDIDWETN